MACKNLAVILIVAAVMDATSGLKYDEWVVARLKMKVVELCSQVRNRLASYLGGKCYFSNEVVQAESASPATYGDNKSLIPFKCIYIAEVKIIYRCASETRELTENVQGTIKIWLHALYTEENYQKDPIEGKFSAPDDALREVLALHNGAILKKRVFPKHFNENDVALLETTEFGIQLRAKYNIGGTIYYGNFFIDMTVDLISK